MGTKAVIIGFAHMHVNDVALYISEQPEFELVGAADVNAGEKKNSRFAVYCRVES